MIDYNHYDAEEMKVACTYSVEITASWLDGVALLSIVVSQLFFGAHTSIENNRLISSYVSSVIIMDIDLSYILSVQPCAVTRCSALQ